MEQRKSRRRWGHACPAPLSMAKSAEAEKAGATQHSPKQRPQSARSLARCPPGTEAKGGSGSGTAGLLLIWDPPVVHGTSQRQERSPHRAWCPYAA